VSEELSIKDGASCDGESGSFVHMLGEFVFDVGVRGHLVATPSASPSFRGAQQFPADPLATAMLLDEPAFDIADGAGNVAAVRTRSKASFEESDKSAVALFRDENG
jgi:hypothetical protein